MAARTMVGRPAAVRRSGSFGLRTAGRRVWQLVLAINGTPPGGDVEAQHRETAATRSGEREQQAAAARYLWYIR